MNTPPTGVDTWPEPAALPRILGVLGQSVLPFLIPSNPRRTVP